MSKLLAAADNDVEKAERGIIFIDEIDKIAKKKNTNTGNAPPQMNRMFLVFTVARGTMAFLLLAPTGTSISYSPCGASPGTCW